MTELPFENLGPFKLGGPLGEGGMSTVFRGVHPRTGGEVALKITRFDHQAGWLRRAFASEIGTLAKVSHPNIVAVYDWGSLPDGSGSWCAMELSDRGALDASHVRSWKDLQRLLVQVLDGLAHAHARGIVHRDIKPPNILAFGDDNAPEFRLADFGLAYSRVPSDDTHAVGASAGTPVYMAPEQLHGLWREYGPWTDLYALGCVAWHLTTGRPPFAGDRPIEIAMAHMKGELAAFEPRFPVPDGFETWVSALLQREWLLRPYSAIAARVALEALPPAVDHHAPDIPNFALGETLPLDTTMLAATLVEQGYTLAPLDPTEVPFRHPDLEPPDHWRAPPRPQTLVGDTGSRLFAFRQPQFIGQERPRTRIWNVFRDAMRTSAPRIITVSSEFYSERELLADWMVVRLRELTTVTSIDVDMSLRRADRDPFRAAIERLTVTWGLDERRLREQLKHVLPRHAGSETDSLLGELADLLTSDDDNYARLASRGAFWSLLTRMTQHQPLVLVLRNVEGDPDVWVMLERLILENHRIIALVVEGDEGVTSDGETWVRARPETHEVALEPLTREEVGLIADGYIQLAPELREFWCDIAFDDIEFAMDNLRYGIAGGVVEPTPQGYRLRDDVEAATTMAQLVAKRLRVLTKFGDHLPRLVGLAASYGASVSFRQWKELAGKAGLELTESAVEQLLRQGYIRQQGAQYVIETPRLRRELIRALSPADKTFVLSASTDGPEGLLRKAELMLILGAPDEAARISLELFDMPEQDNVWLAAWARLARQIQRALAQPNPRLEMGLHVHEQNIRVSNPVLSAVEPIRELLANTSLSPTDPIVYDLRALECIALAFQRKMEEAFEEATRLLEELPESNPRTRADVFCTAGWLAGVLKLPEARSLFDQGLKEAERAQNASFAAQVALYRGALESWGEDTDAAAMWFSRAKDYAAQSHDHERFPLVWLESALAFIVVGDIEQAVEDAQNQWYAGIWSLPDPRGAIGANLAVALGYAGRHTEALDVVEQTRRMLRDDQAPDRAQLDATVALLAALRGDRAAWEECMLAGPPFPGVKQFPELSEKAWLEHGDAARAAEATELLRPYPPT